MSLARLIRAIAPMFPECLLPQAIPRMCQPPEMSNGGGDGGAGLIPQASLLFPKVAEHPGCRLTHRDSLPVWLGWPSEAGRGLCAGGPQLADGLEFPHSRPPSLNRSWAWERGFPGS